MGNATRHMAYMVWTRKPRTMRKFSRRLVEKQASTGTPMTLTMRDGVRTPEWGRGRNYSAIHRFGDRPGSFFVVLRHQSFCVVSFRHSLPC